MRFRFLAAALTAFMALPALAEAASGFATANVNMRSGPSTAYPAVVVIPAGSRLEIHGCLAAEAWCDVSFSRGRGWVSGRYIQTVYGRDRIYVDRNYYGRLGIPIIQFDLDTYWDRNYRQRDFYRERNEWRRGPDRRPPPPPPGWRDDRRSDDRDDWRRGPDRRPPPDWQDDRRNDRGQRWDNRDGQPGWRNEPEPGRQRDQVRPPRDQNQFRPAPPPQAGPESDQPRRPPPQAAPESDQPRRPPPQAAPENDQPRRPPPQSGAENDQPRRPPPNAGPESDAPRPGPGCAPGQPCPPNN